MLKIANITNIQMLSEEWFRGRLAKFTSSEWHYWMGDKPHTVGAMSYTYRKIGEEMTGFACRDEVDTKATEWGHTYEAEGIKAFQQAKEVEFIVTQKLITEEGSRFGSTPDFLVPLMKSADGLYYDVITGEVKCPPSYDKYIALARCRTPAQVKATNKEYFWQVIDQMYNCDALRGFLVIYHPLFKTGGLNIIEFRKLLLREEFKLMEERKKIAIATFNEVREEMFNLKFN